MVSDRITLKKLVFSVLAISVIFVSSVEALEDGPGHMRQRAQGYMQWLRKWSLPAGGVSRVDFTDTSLQEVDEYEGMSDSAIWTGTYLASEALRYMATGSPDALEQIRRTVETLHHWWNVAGDPGVLARYAAPVDSDPKIVDIFFSGNLKDHQNQPYNGTYWHWRGRVSRDQYQGVMLGFSLAYEACEDPYTRALIREDVVEFVEQLMRKEDRRIKLKINGSNSTVTAELQYVVTWDDETPDGMPAIEINTSDIEEAGLSGILDFWPNPSEILREIPLLSWLPDLTFPTQAIQLASHFLVALQVTEGVAEYAQRHDAIRRHYEEKIDEWLDIAAGWTNTNSCGEKYYGFNIAFQPLFNLARLETDPQRSVRIRTEILRDRLWNEVADHKNVFFAYIYASQAHPDDNVATIVATHTAQLDLFPAAPFVDMAQDLSGLYPESESCPGISAIATDLDDRVHETFIWQKDPWRLSNDGSSTTVHAGIDYLIAYWMGRYYGYIKDEAPAAAKTMPGITLLLLGD